MEFITQRPWAVAPEPERGKGATKGLRVINYIVPCVLKSNLFRPYMSYCTFAAACNNKTTRKCSSN